MMSYKNVLNRGYKFIRICCVCKEKFVCFRKHRTRCESCRKWKNKWL